MKWKKVAAVMAAGAVLTAACPVIAGAEEHTLLAASSAEGDVNGDGQFNTADVVILQKWLLCQGLLPDPAAADVCADGRINVLDLVMMKRLLLRQDHTNRIYVTGTEELKAALSAAKAGDEIVLAPGDYIYSGPTPKGRMFTCEAEGTEAQPIILRSEDPENPAVLSGTAVESNYGLTITGDHWIVKDIVVTNASKGIIVDNANHTQLIRCQVYCVGAEGIHFRDNSSYCTADACNIHDTGLVSPGYGEGVYVGSAQGTQGYGFDCHYNTIRSCTIGPNVTAEHIDVKEYTVGTLIEGCTFDGTGMSGQNFSKSFVNVKGNDCILRNCVGYRNNCDKITRAFEANQVADGWGQNLFVYGNRVYMDTAVSADGKKMYLLSAWDCTAAVWDNCIAYEDGVPMSADNEEDHWEYYNCNMLTYGGEPPER